MFKTKVFLFSFFISLSLMLAAYAFVYWSIPTENVDNKQSGIPILNAQAQDSKTNLVITQIEDSTLFFLVKFNGIQKKVGLISIPSNFYMSNAQRTLQESFEYAGIMQCVQDLSQEFDITIHHYLLCNQNTLSNLTAQFTGLDTDTLPHNIAEFNPFSDNQQLDIDTLIYITYQLNAQIDSTKATQIINDVAIQIIKNNMQNIQTYTLDAIKDNFSNLSTNITKEDIERLKRIFFLLNNNHQIEFDNIVLSQKNAQQEIDKLYKE